MMNGSTVTAKLTEPNNRLGRLLAARLADSSAPILPSPHL